MKVSRISNFLSCIEETYFCTKLKKIELLICLIALAFLTASQILNLVPFAWKGAISQLQGILSIYLPFRFINFGMYTALFFTSINLTFAAISYGQTGNISFFTGIVSMSAMVFTTILVGNLTKRSKTQTQEILRLAVTDELTSAHNQRFFHATLEKEIKAAQNNGYILGLLLVDVDNFRMYNDLYGHDYGDTILKNTAAILNKSIDKFDILSRFGGDEFSIILRSKDMESLENKVQQIHENAEKFKNKYYQDLMSKKITFSMGLSVFPAMASNKDELISQADMALYHAKNLKDDSVNFYQDVIAQIQKEINSNEQQIIGMFKGLLSTISAKDKYTVGHCERVASYAALIGDALNMPLQEVNILKYAGLLHDIGKIELPKSLLNKLGRLTDEEYSLIRQHPIYSINILEPLSEMGQLIDYVKHHHERIDGTGYPDGLSGEELSLGARILCVADCFDAMVSERPYRKRMSIEDAFKELERNSGTQFDPKIVKVFIKTMKNKISTKYNYQMK